MPEGLLYRLNVLGVAQQLRAEGMAEAMRDAVATRKARDFVVSLFSLARGVEHSPGSGS